MGKRPFCPRSQGFYAAGGQGPSFGIGTFTANEICDAIQCIRLNSDFFDRVLQGNVLCPSATDAECPNDLALESCAATIRNLLTVPGAAAALASECPGDPFPSDNAILRQYLVNLLNVCISTTTDNGCVGGVLVEYVVDLTEDQATALGFGTDECVTVEEILDLAELALNNCGNVTFSTETLAEVLGDMAQDAGVTIIMPIFCP
ncbi:hypothetical protein [Metabacillus schmidteae]|uniref:hypothetical protein n=1 Tax=Metabacillus schmidteae TaxID=2730405 RepID=UPI001589BD7D|nr:hypothetical protein [Metabacillus schmidteae]